MNREKTCYLCKNDKFKKLEGTVRDNPSLDVLQCENCSLVLLSSFEHINNNFYENGGMLGGTIDINNWLKNTKDDDNRRFNLLKKEIKTKKVLDFGCGNGGFLSRAKRIAQKVVGIDLMSELQKFYVKNGLEVYSDIEQIVEKFDYITMFHVLEHLKNPIELLKNIGEKLAENGEIIIEVPNSNDALLTIYKNRAFMDFTYWSCHLFLFNEMTLFDLVKQAGYKVNYIKYTQRYGLANHLCWQLFKKPNGHKKLWLLNNPIINKFYEKSLAKLKATDTIIISISK